MKTLMTTITAVCLGALALAQQPDEPAKPGPELSKLAVYLGQWRYEGESKPTPLGPAAKFSGDATGEMILQGFFLEWRWKDQGTAGATQGVEILGYSPVSRNYPSSLFSDNGNSISGAYVFAGNTSTFAGTLIAKGKQYGFRATEIFAADFTSFTRTEDISVDGKTWMPASAAKFTKAKPVATPASAVRPRPGPGPNIEEGFFPGAEGIQLFYRKVGTGGATAVYLHGGPTSMNDGFYELEALAAGRTLIGFDQRSGGRSQLVDDRERLTAEYYIRDLEALQRHFGLKRMTLIGQSWGAELAAMFTARHPESVERLLLLSPGPISSAFFSARIKKTNSVIGKAGVARLAEIRRDLASAPDDRVAALCEEQIRLQFRAYLNDVAALDRMRVPYWQGSPAALRHERLLGGVAVRSLGTFDLAPDLVKLPHPALVVEGADTQVPLDATRAWAAAFPNGRLLLVPGTSHLVWLEGDVPKLMRALNQFLAGSWPDGAKPARE